MQFTSTFCFVAILCYAASTGIAHPLSSYDEKESDSFDIVEVDPSALEVEAKVETRRNRPAKYVTAIVRNKRSSDYSDYFSSSSEEGNSFGYFPKPYYHQTRFGPVWKHYRPTSHAGYQLWQPTPTVAYTHQGFNHYYPYNHYHRHYDYKNCKYPFTDTSEYEDNSNESLQHTTTTKKSSSDVQFTTNKPTVTTSTTTTTTTTARPTTTTTTEYIPLIDIRSIH